MLNYFFGRLFSKYFQERRTRLLLEKSSHGFLIFATWSIARKNLLCSNYVEIINSMRDSVFISTFSVAAESDLPELNHGLFYCEVN